MCFNKSKLPVTDFAVGAYKSDRVLLLRSRNIITVHCNVTTTPSPIPLNASGTSCSGGDVNSNPCFTASFCFNYTGEGIDNTGRKGYKTLLQMKTNLNNSEWTKFIKKIFYLIH